MKVTMDITTHFLGWLKFTGLTIPSADNDAEQPKTLLHSWWESKMDPLWKTVWQCIRLNTCLPYDQTFHFEDFTQEMKTYIHMKTWPVKTDRGFILKAPNWK